MRRRSEVTSWRLDAGPILDPHATEAPSAFMRFAGGAGAGETVGLRVAGSSGGPLSPGLPADLARIVTVADEVGAARRQPESVVFLGRWHQRRGADGVWRAGRPSRILRVAGVSLSGDPAGGKRTRARSTSITCREHRSCSATRAGSEGVQPGFAMSMNSTAP